VDVATDSAGQIYVSDNGNNRVLVFPNLIFLPIAAATATAAVGQRDLSGSGANWNSGDALATSGSLYSPLGVYIDRRDTLYVGDAGNNRVVHFLRSVDVSHAANSQASSLARGGLASLSGEGLSDDEATVDAPPLQPSLANREIVFNDEVRAPLSSAGPQRINFQVPWAAPIGSPRIAVRMADTGELLAGTVYPVATYSPGLFDPKDVKILNQDGSVNSPSSPTLKGTIIQLTGTGQGPVSPVIADGEAAPADTEINTVAVPTSNGATCLTRQPSVCVAVGSTFGDLLFSGLAPGQAGVWQLKVRVPLTASSGDSVKVRAVINGIPSNI
jgi:uncharacterized protein (TIGR03437 family)